MKFINKKEEYHKVNINQSNYNTNYLFTIKYINLFKKINFCFLLTYIKVLLIIIIYILIYLNLPKLLIKNINSLKKKHLEPTVCICTLGKSENRYIREFIKYYENFGIDKIFLYDNNDKDGERFEEIINDYINKGFVVLLNWRGKKRSIFKIMNDCYLRNYKIYNWLVFYEIDEYLYLKNYSNIKTFLSESKFNIKRKIPL